MKRSYSKPIMNIEHFMANVAVAACDRLQVGSDTDIGSQSVFCISGNQEEKVFDDSHSCNTTNCTVVYFDGGTYNSADAALTALVQAVNYNATVNCPTPSGFNGNLSAGYYLIWQSSGVWHGGPLSESNYAIMGYSF